MTERTNIQRTLRALLEMAQRGTKHEAEVAGQRLDILLKKHGLTLEEINPATRKIRWFRYETSLEKRLLQHIVVCVLQDLDCEVWRKAATRELGFTLTESEHAQVDRLYVGYRQSLKQKIEQCFKAFLAVNKLFLKNNDPSSRHQSDEEWREIQAIVDMARSMDKTTIYHDLETGS